MIISELTYKFRTKSIVDKWKTAFLWGWLWVAVGLFVYDENCEFAAFCFQICSDYEIDATAKIQSAELMRRDGDDQILRSYWFSKAKPSVEAKYP